MKDVETLLKKDKYDFSDLVAIMAILRSENGCPWDREQDHKSIRNNFIEETYEVIEAIDTGDIQLLREELGDVLLQVVFHARIEEETGAFDISDVANDICAKLISRHPHIFSNVRADTSEAVLQNWEKIKQAEKSRKTVTDTLRAVPFVLPALMRAQKVGKNAAKVGFDFPDLRQALQKVYEEAGEIDQLIAHQTKAEVQDTAQTEYTIATGEGAKAAALLDEEIGDLLFAVVNVARKAGIDSEAVLNRATEKFINRFEKVERLASEEGRNLEKMSLEEMDSLWNRIKSGKKTKKLDY